MSKYYELSSMGTISTALVYSKSIGSRVVRLAGRNRRVEHLASETVGCGIFSTRFFVSITSERFYSQAVTCESREMWNQEYRG